MTITVSDKDFLNILRSVNENFHDALLKRYWRQNPDLLGDIVTYKEKRRSELHDYHQALKETKRQLNRKLHTAIHVTFLPRRISGEEFTIPCTLNGLVYSKTSKNVIDGLRVSATFNGVFRRATVPVSWLSEDPGIEITDWADYTRLVTMTSVYRSPDWMSRQFIIQS